MSQKTALEAIGIALRELEQGNNEWEKAEYAQESTLEPYSGSIELILGPMFSEKSTELLSRVRRAALADQAVVVIKHAKDIRYETGDVVATHAEMRQASAPKTEHRAPIRVVSAERLSNVRLNESVIGVDEGQFFPDLVECCERWANEGRRVIVAALDGDFTRMPFNDTCNLVSRSETVTKMRGVCMHCRHKKSSFSLRLGSSKVLEEIGGLDKYHGVCRGCYFADGGAVGSVDGNKSPTANEITITSGASTVTITAPTVTDPEVLTVRATEDRSTTIPQHTPVTSVSAASISQ